MRAGLVLLMALALVGVAEGGRRAFVDPVTGVLKAHGHADGNEPGDLGIEVTEAFSLQPYHWRWTGTGWARVTPPPTRRERLQQALDEALAEPGGSPKVKEVWQRLKEYLE